MIHKHSSRLAITPQHQQEKEIMDCSQNAKRKQLANYIRLARKTAFQERNKTHVSNINHN